MSRVSEEGRIQIVKLMIEKGADDFNRAMIYAAGRGNSKINECI